MVRFTRHTLLIALLYVLLFAANGEALGANAPEPVCEIVIENLTRGEQMPDLAAVEEAVNAITVPVIRCRVKIENVSIADHERRMALNQALENRLDIVNTGRTTPFSRMVADGMLYPLDELLEEYGPALREKAAALLPGCRIGGQLYCVPSNLYPSKQAGFLYNEELAASCGLVLDEMMTIEDLEKAAELLSQRGVFLLSQGAGVDSVILLGVLFPDIIPVDGTSYTNGVFQGGNWTDIVNVYETDTYLTYCRMLRRWKENGWMPPDAVISGVTGQQLFLRQRAFMTWISVSPIDLALQRKNYPFEIGMFITAPDNLLTTGQIHSGGWGISARCVHPEKAMQLLNLIYSDAELANLLMNGLEGRDYVKLSEHIITYPEGVDVSNVGYSRRFSVFGDFMDIYQWYPTTEDFYNELRNYSQQQTISPVFGYAFDISPVSNEIDAVNGILSEYLPPLECGLIEDVDGAVERMNEELRHAGIQRIIAENQRQLDAWYEKSNS